MKTIFITILFFFSVSISAQEVICDLPAKKPYCTKIEVLKDGSIVYMNADTMPQFKGGDNELLKFIAANLKYPPTCECIQGRVILRFIVREDGKITDITVLSSLDKNYDKEAIRMIESMPKWIPAKHGNKNVACYYTLPITFRLTE